MFANTEDEYGLVAKIFHWAIAVLIVALLPVGLGMGMMENSPVKFQIFAMHKSFGLLVFFLGLVRILWRFISPPPDHLQTHEHWEVTLAGAAHFWLYICIIGMPLSGWLLSNAGEYPVPFFGIQMPALISKNENLGALFGEVHEILGYTLLFVLGLHVAGALKHHVLDKDDTIKRMAWPGAGWGFVVVVVLYMTLSYGLSTKSIVQDLLSEESEATAGVENAAVDLATPDTDKLPEHGWAIIPGISKLQFQATLYKQAFTGDFNKFSGRIIFDPADLSSAKADITIDLKDITTGDKDRDSNIVGTEWFNVAEYPTAHFVTDKFEKADANNYVAIGNLTIRDKTMPLLIPFSLDIQNHTANMKGEVVLNRTNFGVGQGEWADESSVGHDVKVIIDLKAAQ